MLTDDVTRPVCVYVGAKVLFGIIFVGVEVLTTTDLLFVCRVWNKQLLVATPKPGVKLVDVCVCVYVHVFVCVCAHEYRCLTEWQGLTKHLVQV